MFSRGDRGSFTSIVDNLLGWDEYLVLADYRAYVDAQDFVEEVWRDTDRWTRMSIRNAAGCGFFSADRTVREYCARIWHAEPVPVTAGRDATSR